MRSKRRWADSTAVVLTGLVRERKAMGGLHLGAGGENFKIIKPTRVIIPCISNFQ